MAEFKLGRIRFVWQGAWNAGQTYAIDDVISKGGKSYICTVNHVAQADFVNDLQAQPTKWNIVADGTTWRGNWTANTLYNAGDEVKYGGVVYICTLGHNSANTNPITVNVTNASPNAGKVTLTFDSVSPNPFPVGSQITVANVNTSGSSYNGTYTVTASTTSSVTYTNATTDAYVSGGTIYSFGGLEATGDRWQTFAQSFNWTGNWAASTRYRVNDFVQYGGFVYICIIPHISSSLVANGLEADQLKWQVFNQGITYLGAWSGSSVRYKLNDVVKYGADVWICTQFHTSSTTFDDTKWSIMVSGFQFENSWNSSTVYQVGDTVTYGGYSYIAKTNHTNKQPTTNPDAWDVFTTGFNFRSEYDAATAYKIGDTIRQHGYTYVAVADSTGQLPTNTSYWSRLNSGFYWTNTPQTYGAVAGTNVSGTGSNARFDIIRSGTVYNVTLTSGGSGAGYAIGNVIKILGSALGGITPANDLIITVGTVGAGQSISTFTWSGRSATWTTGTVYVLGDVVLFGGNSYICVSAHTASSPSRPDNDVSATYWNVLTIGSEVNVLTSPGDMLYYGPNGPTRLPVGVDGQILRSTSGFPAWANYGLIQNVVYVGPLGKDEPAPASGLTIDKPWKTVRYANKQIEDGYRNPNARDLLYKNKQFMMKEVNNFLLYTYTVSVTGFNNGTYQFATGSTAGLIEGMPISFSGTALGGVTLGQQYFVKTIVDSTHFTICTIRFGTTYVTTGSATGTMTGNLVYDQAKTERDTGYIIDGVIYDLSRGGTWKTVLNGGKYFNDAGNLYITTATGYLVPNFVASHVYLKTIFASILSNQYTVYNYQSLNGVATGQRAVQIIDSTLIAESSALDYANSLVDIISGALTQGSATALPTPIQPNTTINIKTGTYNEVLPIYLAENTALVGDELRTSVVQPAAANPLLANDKAKTISALNRISALIPSIVANTTVSPTSGNTAQQVYFGYSDTTATTSVTTNLGYMYTIVNTGLAGAPAFTLTDPTSGTGNAFEASFFNARRLLLANKAFLISEISAWISAQIAGNIAPFVGFIYGGTAQTNCERDVGYIIDAVRYDLTYGGNLETSAAARAYYSYGNYVGDPASKLRALAVQARIKDIIDNIVMGNTAGWTKTTSSTQDISGTAGLANSGLFCQARIQEIYDTINTGFEPVTIYPDTGWVSTKLKAANTALLAKKTFVQQHVVQWVQANYPSLSFNTATCSRDVGYIIDALGYDLMFGSNFRSVKAGMSYYQAQASVVVGAQKSAQLGMLTKLITVISDITDGINGSAGSTTAVTKTKAATKIVYDILSGGLTAIPTLILPNPTGYNTATLTHTAYASSGNATGSTLSYGDSRTQIVQNYAFIQAEISAYLALVANGYSTVWASLGATGQAACLRDITYILDAVRYDITYGGNTQSLIAGSAYYSNFQLVIQASEKTITAAAFTYLKSIVDQIARKVTVTPTSGNTTPQVTTGTVGAGGIYASAFAQARVQDVLDWLNNGTANTTVTPCTTWCDTNLLSSYTALQAKRTEIASDATVWIKKFFQSVSFDSTLSTRDSGLIVDAIAYDMLLGTNFNSIKAGMSFYRALSSTQNLLSNEKAACLGALSFIRQKASLTASNGAAAQAQKIISDIVSYIPGGAKPPGFMWPNPSNINSGYAGAQMLVHDNREFIKAEIAAFLAQYTTGGFSWSTIGTDRQTAYINNTAYLLEGLVYDMKYGGTYATKQAAAAYYSFGSLQILSADTAPTLAAFGYLKTLVQAIAIDTVASSPSPYQATITQVRADALQTVGSAGAATQLGALVDIATNYINNGPTSGTTTISVTTVASGTTFTTGSAHGLKVGDIIVPQTTPAIGAGGYGLSSGTIYYVVSTPLTTTFTLSTTWAGTAITTFTNGTGLTLALETTVMPVYSQVSASLVSIYTTLNGVKSTLQGQVTTFINTNYPTLVYSTSTCSRDVGYIIDAVGYDMMLGSNYQTLKAALSYYRAQSAKVVGAQKIATVAAFRYLKTIMIAAVSANATASASVKSLMNTLINIVKDGANDVVDVMGTITYNNDLGVIKGSEVLRANASFLANEATAWINSQYGGTVGSVLVGNIVQTNNAHNLIIGDPVKFTGVLGTSTIVPGTVYYVLSVPSTTQFTMTSTPTGTVAVNIVADLTPTLVAQYGYDATACQRDMTEYVLALVYDLKYPGNYKSMRAATLYKNAVEGSQRSDMFYVRNACGVRNMTLNGLNGDLTEINDYGTKRPTAGSYTSLDPGFGPNDTQAWVTFRSTYCQNVSLFGTGCVGMKIDGALHAGGNRSIVANDYTTILSDGIGVWCTGSQSLTELVSVFCYYSYSGYLAELGGRIRATNGNSSYGVYGVIAEGTDSTEIPLYSNLDNRAAPAAVNSVITDGVNKVLRFEYGNAGGRYTNYNPAISGAGINATAIGDEFRDDAVFETRLIDKNDGNGYGGKDYTTAINAAQSGDLVSITISATDTALSTAYPTARVHITAGAGVGQYANILTYSNGTKIAKVYKDSFTQLTVTATSTTNNLLTVASTATLYTGMPLYLTGTMTGTGGATGLSANTVYYVNSANFSATQFQVSTTPGGAGLAVTILNNVTALTIGLLEAGWDNVIPGTAPVNPLDLTTTYLIEPRINYSSPGYTATARTLVGSTTWGQVKYGAGRFVATATGATNTSYSLDGKTWAAGGTLPSAATWAEPVFGGGSGAVATATVGGLGGSGAVLIAVLGKANTTGAAGADQVASVTIVNGGTGYSSPPTITFTPVSGGSNAKAVCTVLNGVITSISTNSNDGGSFGSGYLVAPTVTASTDKVTVIVVNSWGNNYLVPPTVTLSGGGASAQATATAGLSNNGVYTITVTDGGTGYTSAPTVTITDTTAAFATIVSGGTATSYLLARSSATTNWTSGGVLPSANHVAIAYGNGVYVAVGSTATASSTAALASAWTGRTMITTTGTWSDVTYAAGIFLAIATGANTTAYSINGSTWVQGGNLPASTTWTSVAYGNGRFIAMAVTGAIAYSLDFGLTWIASNTATGTTTSVLSSTYTWKKIRYGQGLFFAITTGSAVCATSGHGINWTVRAMSISSAWNGLAFGNPGNDGQWVAVSSTSGTIAMSAKTGAYAIGRMKATAGTLQEVRMIEPGSGYPYGTVTATTVTTNVITTADTTNLLDSQPIEFTGLDSYGLTTNTTYYVIGSTIVTNTSFKVSATAGSATAVLLTTGTALSGTYRTAPITTQYDPNKTVTAPLRTRMGDGVLGNPTFTNRGTLNTTATALITGDGNADFYQATNFISVRNLFAIPQAGSNVVFNSIPGVYYKLVTISNILAAPADGAGQYTAVFQLSPALTVQNAPAHLDKMTTTIKYSQTRLTGHDFLYIGTGNKAQTNYPYVDPSKSSISAQTLGTNGGRVFFTSTDQDGNFNVGNLFGVQQATGTATLNANAFNLSGLQSLQLSGLSLGVGSATITQFSTDPYFTANSDNVLPTQRAIKSYITAQIGGGLSQLNVNTLTAGVVYIANNSISTTSGGQLNITAKMNFTGGIDGAPVALGFFMQR
jgi:hypothetical protein